VGQVVGSVDVPAWKASFLLGGFEALGRAGVRCAGDSINGTRRWSVPRATWHALPLGLERWAHSCGDRQSQRLKSKNGKRHTRATLARLRYSLASLMVNRKSRSGQSRKHEGPRPTDGSAALYILHDRMSGNWYTYRNSIYSNSRDETETRDRARDLTQRDQRRFNRYPIGHRTTRAAAHTHYLRRQFTVLTWLTPHARQRDTRDRHRERDIEVTCVAGTDYRIRNIWYAAAPSDVRRARTVVML
jgi:hypothetical protein